MKSTSGYVFAIGGGAMTWKSSKQTCIARSTMDAELIALEKACSKAEWHRNLSKDLLIDVKSLTFVYIDSNC